uniref:Integrase catalytic domain-containing protein n=1 Tax=Cannabis sativa TaxID=3483 RepID=A0A803PQD4_CANSA
MAKRFNMVSEQFPPLSENMATTGMGNNGDPINSNTSRAQNQQNGTSVLNRSRNTSNDHNPDRAPPPQFLNDSDQASNNLNPDFLDWEVQDQLLSRPRSWSFEPSCRSFEKALCPSMTIFKVKQHVDLLASLGEVLCKGSHCHLQGSAKAERSILIKNRLSANLATIDLDQSPEVNIAYQSYPNRGTRFPNFNRTSSNYPTTRGGGRGYPTRVATTGNNYGFPNFTNNRGISNVNREGRFDKSFIGVFPSSNSPTNQANLAQTTQTEDTSWYPDSGATNHCTPNMNNPTTTHQVTRAILFTGKHQNGLYIFNPSQFQVQLPPSDVSPSVNTASLSQQHEHHVSVCSNCKIHKLPFPKASLTVYTEPLQLVVADLWGPAIHTSTNGYKYYIQFVDAYSRFTWIYMLKQKSEVLKTFTQFKAESELQLGKPIKCLQTDWGGLRTVTYSSLAETKALDINSKKFYLMAFDHMIH